MDPLGARPEIVQAMELVRWNETLRGETTLPQLSSLPNAHVITPFPIREDLNGKIALWTGDLALLQVDAVVNPTNETLTDKNAVSQRLHQGAGPELRDECKTQVGSCRTGEARITAGYGLPARHVIHTVGPRYNLRYKTAAESALYNCYRSVLQIVKSRHLASIAFSVHNSSRRGYPADEGANIAIRTVRRFLEHYGENVELVVFVTDGVEVSYQQLLPLYFPRSAEEEAFAARALPAAIGDELGEPIIPERTIRIAVNPVSKGDGEEGEEEPGRFEEGEDSAEKGSDFISEVGRHPFAEMTADKDGQRKEFVSRNRQPTEEETQRKKYKQLQQRARTENFQDLAGLGAFYRAGVDYLGRQVVVYVGRLFPASKVDLSKAVAYFVHVMEPVVSKEYVLVYFHSDSQPEQQPDSAFFKQIYCTVDARYRDNLSALYIVHPSWWFKLSAWWFLTFTASEVKERVQYLSGVQYLFDTINPDQIEIPQFVFDHDKQLNGVNYYSPASRGDEATGGL